MALRLSPFARSSAVTIPRQLAPTMGLLHDGFKFLEGNFEGIKGYAVGRVTKSHRGKLYIDDEGLGPRGQLNRVRVSGPLRRNSCLHRQDRRTEP